MDAHATHSNLALGGDGEGGGHAGVLEGAGGVHALVLGEEPVDAGGFGAAGEIVEGGVAFAEGDDVFEVVDDGKQVAETPDAGLVDREAGGAALLPEPAEGAGVGQATVGVVRGVWGMLDVRPGVNHLVEALALRAAKVAADVIFRDDGGAFSASKVMCRDFHGFL